ncbi:class I SAM-dependent methyltransferase [Fulvivirga sp. 29W222]|uniref:Class I SAM-dependent methyltransferase n=1 Tax=Fulvivirga marina TaxID=2494733 RepID=A0A937G162_9BACT|nr:class I SAM-dependent methyltransferase [Fulvivirga marina]MBL6449919.1 class I SAM-dependent methyltransferase [Fulvivirga marina]
MANNFNSVAFIYDTLARLVFGRSIQRAQAGLLYYVQNASKVLVLGGGTGFILQELDKLGLSLKVTYVEPSSAMIDRSKKKSPFRYIDVDFVQSKHDAVFGAGKFDVVITNFFLDVFTEEQLRDVVRQVSLQVDKGGMWLLTDFVITKIWWQRMLVRLMYFFFRVTAGLEGDRLLNFEEFLAMVNFKPVYRQYYYHGMIRSDIYKRDEYPL